METTLFQEGAGIMHVVDFPDDFDFSAVAIKGKVIFTFRGTHGDYRSRTYTDPSWDRLLRCANRAIKVTRSHPDGWFLEAVEVDAFFCECVDEDGEFFMRDECRGCCGSPFTAEFSFGT